MRLGGEYNRLFDLLDLVKEIMMTALAVLRRAIDPDSWPLNRSPKDSIVVTKSNPDVKYRPSAVMSKTRCRGWRCHPPPQLRRRTSPG